MVRGRAWTGFEAVALQEAMRKSIREYAALLGIDTTTIANWRSGLGAVHPRPRMQEILDTTLDQRATPDDRIRFEQILAEGEQVWRRRHPGNSRRPVKTDICSAISSVGIGDRLRNDREGIDADRLAYVAAHPRQVDRTALDELSVVLAAIRKLDDSLGSESVLPAVNGTVITVERLVREARGSIRPAVLNIGAQWLQMSGWLNTTTKRHTIARTVQDRMLEWSVELDDPDLISTTLGVKGHRAWTQDEFGPMIGLSEAAGRYGRASPAVLAVAAQQQARGHALVGEAEETERKLDQADDYAVSATVDPERIPPWLYFHSTDLLVLQRGLAYKYLAESGRRTYRRKAIDTLSAGLAGLDRETRESDWMRWYFDQLDELTRTC
ncbi:hypothetical protein K7711_39565 [Nocardia sp. CA2R105]|uniref:hypothetical protein n=1 Tax=Nocardia coffeae TaxID=2873381 RepID=UPI001CA615D3|nr:hypothetical protein [Nocardia coffeae]MBY8862623.1 hypothetical protein [Nocardia coffeae]